MSKADSAPRFKRDFTLSLSILFAPSWLKIIFHELKDLQRAMCREGQGFPRVDLNPSASKGINVMALDLDEKKRILNGIYQSS